jgi:tetratricopeptide (TPR) repeat protein
VIATGKALTQMSEIRRSLHQATAAFELGEFAKAESLLLEVLRQAPTYANVYNMLGVIAGHRNAPQEAVTLFRQALNLNPHYREAQVNLAITLAEMGAYDQAAQEVDALEQRETTGQTSLSPGVLGKLANAHADLGQKYHALRLYAQAVVEYDRALGLCPTFPDIHVLRALSCRELGDDAGARGSLQRALELNPNYVEAHVNLGLLHQKAGNLSEAVKTWERALELNPEHRIARVYLVQATASGTSVE